MEQLRCGAVVSNLEGIKGLPFWMQDMRELATLPVLERRVRRLEAAVGITPPPPVAKLSWNGLVWRTWRLRNRMPRDALKEFEAETCIAGADFKSMMPGESDISLQDVQDALASISIRVHGAYPPIHPELDNDQLQLSYSLQRLCHIAGKKGLYFDAVPVTLVDVYVLAVRLSLHTEGDDHRKMGVMGCWPRPAPVPAPVPARRAKPCCDCCGCFCHTKAMPMPLRQRRWHRSSSTASSVETEKPRSRFAWLGKLCFWRKTALNDRASVTSRGSSTIVD